MKKRTRKVGDFKIYENAPSLASLPFFDGLEKRKIICAEYEENVATSTREYRGENSVRVHLKSISKIYLAHPTHLSRSRRCIDNISTCTFASCKSMRQSTRKSARKKSDADCQNFRHVNHKKARGCVESRFS